MSLLGIGGKGCSFGVHGAYVDGVQLPTLPQAEAELYVLRPCLAGQKKSAAAPITLTFPPVKKRQMSDSLRLRNQDYLCLLYTSQVALFRNCPVEEASLMNSRRSLRERRVEPLGNLNKIYRAQYALPTL